MASLRYSNRTGSAYYVVFGEAYGSCLFQDCESSCSVEWNRSRLAHGTSLFARSQSLQKQVMCHFSHMTYSTATYIAFPVFLSSRTFYFSTLKSHANAMQQQPNHLSAKAKASNPNRTSNQASTTHHEYSGGHYRSSCTPGSIRGASGTPREVGWGQDGPGPNSRRPGVDRWHRPARW